jgi:hypothetical protein
MSLALALACSPPRGGTAVILDEAFVAARPGLAASLEGGIRGPLPFWSGPGLVVVSLDRGTEGLLAAARKAGFHALPDASQGLGAPSPDEPAALVTSPLFAAALLAGEGSLSPSSPAAPAGISALGGAMLVVPEWRKGPNPRIFPVATDPLPAFAAAGRTAGAYVAALQASGEASAAGAIVFRATGDRGGGALDAFSDAFRAAAGFPPLVEELRGPDEAAETDAAVARLLAADLRIVLVAAGPASSSACGKLARPGLAVGIESSEASDFPGAAFGILPDDRALAAAVLKAARGLRKGGAGAGTGMAVPARLLAYSRASGASVAKNAKEGPDLAPILAANGAIKAKSP